MKLLLHRHWRRLGLMLLLVSFFLPFSANAENFTYQGIDYSVINEEQATCATRDGSGINGGMIVSGDLVLPSTVYNGDKAYKLVGIGWYSFKNSKDLKNITLPNTLTTIGIGAFSGCKGLSEVTIPKSVTAMYSDAFLMTGLERLNLLCPVDNDYFSFKGLDTKATVYCHASEYSDVSSLYKGKVSVFQYPYTIQVTEQYICGFKFKLVDANNTVPDFDKLKYTVTVEGGSVKKTIEVEPDKEYIVDGLPMQTNCTLVLNWSPCEIDGLDYQKSSSTKKTAFSLKSSATQTTITVSEITAQKDPTATPGDIYYRLGTSGDYKKYNKGELKFKDLTTNANHKLYLKTNYSGTEIEESVNIRTLAIAAELKSIVGPTSIQVKGIYDAGDSKVSYTTIKYFDHSKVAWSEATRDNFLNITTLDPNSKFTFVYSVRPEKGNATEYEQNYTTTLLEMEMLTPKAVSPSSAIVAASTNIADIEPNVGFEWKKYDAPSSLSPNEGYGAVYDGTLEGYIKNLQSTSYYNVRAFYKNAAGVYTYTDWVTFDPSDFSYFEPTIHTYPVENVNNTSASLRAYVLSGSDAIKRQGFQYWKGKNSSKVEGVQYAPLADEIQTVESKGQVMGVIIENLEPGTDYICRAFVETDAGMSYGEEQTFTTTGTAGVDNVSLNVESPVIVGYYDLNGRRYDSAQRGFNIVIYSDGTTSKLVIR